MEYKSNYEKVTEDWKKRFLDMDQERLIERFQLNHDGQWLYLRYLGQQLKLSRTSGKVLFADREEIPEFDTVITVYNMFYYAKEHPGEHARADVIVVDPPRKGCERSVLDTMVQMEPERIVYVSCDSATLARDVKYLRENGYEIRKVKATDMFPMSVHVETVCLLSRKAPV